MNQDEVYEICQAKRKSVIPTPDRIVNETFQELGLLTERGSRPGITPAQALRDFNGHLFGVFERSLKVLERYERRAYIATLKEIVRRMEDRIAGKPASDVVEAMFDEMWWVMQSRSQSRKSRGGSDFQYEFEGMLRLCDIPFAAQARRERVDLVFPSVEFFERNRSKSIVVSLKRTLRERWREVVEELYTLRAPNVYIGVAEGPGGISGEKVKQIEHYNIHLLVWDETKREDFPDEPSVMGYTEFANDELQSFRRYWK